MSTADMALCILELFCCAGGMSEGFRRAGAPAAYVVDWDADACASYEANLGHRPLRLDVHDIARTGELMPGARLEQLGLDLIVADPPCTPWSVAGKRRGLDDPRDCLQATVAIILRARPRAYLIGNVPGLDHAPNLPALRRVLEPLRAAGTVRARLVRANRSLYVSLNPASRFGMDNVPADVVAAVSDCLASMAGDVAAVREQIIGLRAAGYAWDTVWAELPSDLGFGPGDADLFGL